MMNDVFDKIVNAFKNSENLEFTDDEFIDYDKFIDDEIFNGNLVKVNEYSFNAVKLAEKINERLSSKIIHLCPYDARIDMKCKGQAVYFLVNDQVAILTFSSNAITFFPQK